MNISSLPEEQLRQSNLRLAEERELVRRWTVYLVVLSFLVGLGLCLNAPLNDNYLGPGSASTLTHSAQVCEAPAVPCEDQGASKSVVATSFFGTEQNPFYEGVSLPPPSPPPRG